jgi:Na+-translocating ferredoxin:NAD+ oxidoreductase RNF subunit RnfB
MEILIPILILGSLGLLFGVGLGIASKKLAVQADPRIEKVHGLLPGTNCGACGGAGCFGFAEGLLSGKFSLAGCKVSTDAQKEKIAGFLGQKIEKTAKKVAAPRCFGGKKVKDKFIYQGLRDCAAANLVLGGQKECFYGCLGFGSCVKICPFGAITMSVEDIPVVNEVKCKACTKCVLVCPKKLFTLTPVSSTVYVACASRDCGKDTLGCCPVGCIACGACVKACKFNAITITSNLAVIDYEKCTSCGDCIKVCPAKTIKKR